VAAGHLRGWLENAPEGLQVKYFGSVDEAREWIAR
jgi:hypothetical protein